MSIIPVSENPRGAVLIIVQSIFIFLDILAVGGRLWARQIKNKSLEFNDWSIIVALVIMIGRFGSEISMVVETGFGLHAQDIAATYGPAKILQFGMLSFANDMLWLALVTIIKLSVLELYTKIFRQPLFVKVTWVVFAICAGTGVAFTLVRALICRPVQMNWDFSLATQGGTCGNLNTMYLSLATIDLILDLLVVFLPMPVVWNLQMAFSKKIAITIVFGLGAAICCITAVRLKFINEIDVMDPQYSQIKFNIFAALEPLLGIINACLPVLPPVFAKFWRSAAFQTAKGRTGNSSNSAANEYRKSYGGLKSPGLVSTASTGRQFERLDDEYPLHEVKKADGGDEENKLGGIQVSTQWDIEYSSSKSGDDDNGTKPAGIEGPPHAL